MRKLTLAATAFCFVLSGVAFGADGFKLDATGKCHSAEGKFTKAEMCKATTSAHTCKLDAKKKCRDENGKFAKANLWKA